MTENTNIEFKGEIDRYEKRSNDVSAHLRFWKEDEITKGGALDYTHQLVPRKGSFSAARFDVSISIAPEQHENPMGITSRSSTSEVRAELVDLNQEACRFSLQGGSDGSLIGHLWLHPDYVPGWLNAEGNQCYMTIGLEYDHLRTKEETNYSEAKIDNIRGEEKQMFD